MFPANEVVLAKGEMIFLLYDAASSNFYYYSFDGQKWNETDVYIHNDDENIIRNIKKELWTQNYGLYGRTLTVKTSKKERLKVILIFREIFFSI